MERRLTSIDKVTRPDTSRAFPREGLYQALDGALAGRAAWLSAPAGSGKTTLMSSYIESRGLPCLWYQIDEGDADPASFFYHLGLAAAAASSESQVSLPIFTPEYLLGIPVFAKRWFSELSKHLKHRNVIVFDECERLGDDATFFDLLMHGLDALPVDASVVMISRASPPPSLARLRARRKMEVVGWEELRLTPEESEGIVRLHAGESASCDSVRQLHERSQGWVSALVLMLERLRRGNDIASLHAGEGTSQDLFNYLAAEMFNNLDEPTQGFLIKTAVMEVVLPEIADRLVGINHSERILANLAGRNYFTMRRGDAGGGYRYHPLFREFLLYRLESRFKPDEVALVRQQAAALLDESDRPEEAADLYIEAEDWDGLARIALREAQKLVGQGRGRTMEGWLSKMPSELLRDNPWLLYWQGICRFPFSPSEARGIFGEAFELFRAKGEKTGMMLAWSSAASNALYEGEYCHLDSWIAEMDELLAAGEIPDPAVEGRVFTGMFSALSIRQPYRQDIAAWEEKALSVLRVSHEKDLQLQAGFYLLLYYLWMGRFADSLTVLDRLRYLFLGGGGTDFMRIFVLNMEAVYGFFTGDYDGAAKSLKEGHALAEESGIHHWDMHMHELRVAAALGLGDTAVAGRLLKELAPRLSGVRTFDVAYYYFLSTCASLRQGNIEKACNDMRTASDLITSTGFTSCMSHCALCMAEVMHEKGVRHEAESYLAEAYRTSRHVRSRYLEFQCMLVEANIAFDHADEERALDALRKGLELGREQSYFNTIMWRPEVMSRLCARALEAVIEVEYVKDFIRRRKLVPEMGDVQIENWPWPAQVYTLGRFALVKDGVAVATAGKAQKKTLDLLKAIIALGGRDVSVEQLADTFWGNSEADAATTAFRVALHRLRQMLGEDRAIQVQDGRVQLDPRFVWVDVIAFERALAAARKAEDGGREDEATRLMEDALRLYKGHFLAQEQEKSWVAPMQERLKVKFRNAVSAVGCRLAGRGALKKAVECWHGALQVDNVVEEFYQQLMTCYHNDGCRAEAAEVYHRCTKALADVLGITPSEKTQAIYKKILE